jgi:hypothetical protein
VLRARLALLVLTVGCDRAPAATDTPADVPGLDAPTPDVPGLDAPAPDVPRDDAPGGTGSSLRFFGQGGVRGDRVRVRVDDPASAAAGPRIDVGGADFTIELFIRAAALDNPNTIDCSGPTSSWTNSHIFVDRDRHSQPPTYGVGLAGGRVVWAVQGPAGDPYTLCGSAIVADGAWHHVAVDRRRSDGWIRIWVDGALDGSADGPDGDVSYPDDGTPLSVCPDGLCDYSDPFLVFGAEKHGYGGISLSGWLDEIRISDVLRYDAPFTPPSAAFTADASTAGLFHLDEGAGASTADAVGGPSGELVLGGMPEGPSWSTEAPF